MKTITQLDVDRWHAQNPNAQWATAPQWVRDYCIAKAEKELIAEGEIEPEAGSA